MMVIASSDNTGVAAAAAAKMNNGHDKQQQQQLDLILDRITLVEDEVKALRSENKSIYCIIKTLADDVKALIANSASGSPGEVSSDVFVKPEETAGAPLKKKQKMKKRGLAKFATGVSLMSVKMKLMAGLVPIAIILSVVVGIGQGRGIIGDKTSQPARNRKLGKIKEEAVICISSQTRGEQSIASFGASHPRKFITIQ